MGAPTRPGEVFARLFHGHSVAKARGGFGKRLVRLLIPLCFWPVGGHGRSRRATIPPLLRPPVDPADRVRGALSRLMRPCHGLGRAPGVRFGPAALPAAHRQPVGLAGPVPNVGLFWDFDTSPARGVMSQKLTGSRRSPHRGGLGRSKKRPRNANTRGRRRFVKRRLPCVLAFLGLFLTSLGLLYGDSDETR